jgi:hypothetical protein
LLALGLVLQVEGGLVVRIFRLADLGVDRVASLIVFAEVRLLLIFHLFQTVCDLVKVTQEPACHPFEVFSRCHAHFVRVMRLILLRNGGCCPLMLRFFLVWGHPLGHLLSLVGVGGTEIVEHLKLLDLVRIDPNLLQSDALFHCSGLSP